MNSRRSRRRLEKLTLSRIKNSTTIFLCKPLKNLVEEPTSQSFMSKQFAVNISCIKIMHNEAICYLNHLFAVLRWRIIFNASKNILMSPTTRWEVEEKNISHLVTLTVYIKVDTICVTKFVNEASNLCYDLRRAWKKIFIILFPARLKNNLRRDFHVKLVLRKKL